MARKKTKRTRPKSKVKIKLLKAPIPAYLEIVTEAPPDGGPDDEPVTGPCGKTRPNGPVDHSKDKNPADGRFLPGNRASVGFHNRQMTWRKLMADEGERLISDGKGDDKITVARACVRRAYAKILRGDKDCARLWEFITKHTEQALPTAVRVEHDRGDPEMDRKSTAELMEVARADPECARELDAMIAAGVLFAAEGEGSEKEGEVCP